MQPTTTFVTGTSSGPGGALAENPLLSDSRSRGTESMPNTKRAAEKVLSILPQPPEAPSDGFPDIRQRSTPAAHAKLRA